MRLKDLKFRPALLNATAGYGRADFSADLGAGLTVACVALPLAMAFGIASGVKPEQGLITAIVGGFIVSALGGSRVQVAGPAGAFVALLYAIAERYGIANLLISTMLAGVLLIAMGALHLGQMVRFVPVPIVIGFTNGIAVIIALSQLKDFLGLDVPQMPANFFSQLATLRLHLDTINGSAFALGVGALAILAIWPRAPRQTASRKDAIRQGLPVAPIAPIAPIAPTDFTAPAPASAVGGAATAPIAEAAVATPTAHAAHLHAASIAEPIAASATVAEPIAASGAASGAAGPEARSDAATTRAGTAERFAAVLRRVPGPLVVLVFGTLLVWAMDLPIDTIGTRFGGIPQSLPAIQLPSFDWQSAQNLVAPTLSIAFLGAIESLLCARVADGMIGERHDPNQELMAQGIANVVSPLFGGIAVTGTIARTVTNVRSGARTPVAGMIHSLALLGFMLLLAPLAIHIPMAVLAAILLFVAYNMCEWHAFAQLRHFSNNYRIVMVSTFLLTVIFDLTVAVQVGLLLASLMFIIRISSLTRLEPVRLPSDLAVLADGRRVGAWRVFGSLFFGSIGKLEALQTGAEPLPDVVVLELHQVINMDTTGLDAIQSLRRHLQRSGGRLILAEPNEQPLSLMKRAGFLAEIGPENVFTRLDDVYRTLRA